MSLFSLLVVGDIFTDGDNTELVNRFIDTLQYQMNMESFDLYSFDNLSGLIRFTHYVTALNDRKPEIKIHELPKWSLRCINGLMKVRYISLVLHNALVVNRETLKATLYVDSGMISNEDDVRSIHNIIRNNIYLSFTNRFGVNRTKGAKCAICMDRGTQRRPLYYFCKNQHKDSGFHDDCFE